MCVVLCGVLRRRRLLVFQNLLAQQYKAIRKPKRNDREKSSWPPPKKKTATKKQLQSGQHNTKLNLTPIKSPLYAMGGGGIPTTNICVHTHTHEIMFNLLQFLGDSNTMVISCASVHVIGLKERYLCPPHPMPSLYKMNEHLNDVAWHQVSPAWPTNKQQHFKVCVFLLRIFN